MNRLKKLRESKGLTQFEFGKLFNASQNAVSNWENGNRRIDNERLVSFAAYFNVSTDYLLGRDCTTLPNEKEPTVNDDGLRAKAIERVQALSDPELVRVLDFLKGLEAGQEIESVPASDSDPTPKSSE